MSKSSGSAPAVDYEGLLNKQSELNRINQVTPFGSVFFGEFGNDSQNFATSPGTISAPSTQQFPWLNNYQSGVSPGSAGVPVNAADLLAQSAPAQPAPTNTFSPTSIPGQPDNFQTVSPITQVTQLSPEVQALFDQQIGTANQIGAAASAQAGQLPTEAFNFDESGQRSRVEQAIFDRAKGLLDPVFAQQESRLRDSLANSGQLGTSFVNPGGRQELDIFGRNRSETFENVALDAIAQGESVLGNEFNRALTQRAVPFNELASLLQGSQVNVPLPNQQAQPIDVLGTAQLQQNNLQANASNKAANQRALMGGLFGLGAAAISDRRAKTDIKRVGQTDDGLPIYTYRYKWGGPVQMGVMAQEVEKVNPEAVIEIAGLKAVNYGAL